LGAVASEQEVTIRVRLSGRGAHACVVGCFIGRGKGSLRLNTLQLHDAPDTTSDLLVKSVVYDSSSFYYNGVIEVSPIAQKADAYQRNENLVLSPHTSVETKPTLEIRANDVRCTHGATTGPISREELWYLTSRGIPEREAERLIVTGFLEHALEKISGTMAKEQARKKIWQLL
jgi:Fe-S cluster assembly protein SufD